ncbi:MAG TPA: CoB--CoM heterodisulfide reductase iron-sulfur subunit A family protein [Anaerolineales bacterium]|nr:CoB--CoM heterodisulfide reductase iron-sulfur subunit A family protein [Anaerolineales bacterium]
MAPERKIGVFVCRCGGNVSDYVDVEKVREEIATEPGVVIAKTQLFACSDAAQQEMISDIHNARLDGLVVASCAPSLHLHTFRGMAKRAGLNPYQYVQVNLREQCSWAHTNDKKGATEKAVHLIRAGIARCALTNPLNPLRVETQPRVLVIGAGVAGMRASLSLADMGLAVYLIEKEEKPGGWSLQAGRMGPEGQLGPDVVATLLQRIRQHGRIVLYAQAELIEKTGSIGDFNVKVNVKGETVPLNVGSIIVTTGFAPYVPHQGEYGWGTDRVVDLLQFRQMLANGKLEVHSKAIHDVAFIYCVGSRQTEGTESCPEPNRYCSRYCCSAATYTAVMLHELAARTKQTVNQYHLYRDVRTYGNLETIYEEARCGGALFLRWEPAHPPIVEEADGRISVKIQDTLEGGEELEIRADLVVLVTGMEPRENEQLNQALKLPRGADGFYKEIHPKLRPVETVIDGVFIAGAAQGPKTMSESVTSALAAVAKTGSLLKKGYVDLEPLIAQIDTEKCTWCDECLKACPYNAIEKMSRDDKEVAMVIASLCKGEGACVPVCPHDAIAVEGFRNDQILAMIDASLREAVA